MRILWTFARNCGNLRDTLLRPLQVLLDLLRRPHAIGEISLEASHSACRKLLQFHELPGFGVQLSRSKNRLVTITSEWRDCSRLRLSRKTAIQRHWIVRTLQSIAHVVHQIDAGSAAR